MSDEILFSSIKEIVESHEEDHGAIDISSIEYIENFACQNHVAISIFDQEQWKYLYYSQNYYDFFGVKKSEAKPEFPLGYQHMFQDASQIRKFVRIQDEIINEFSNDELVQLSITICGFSINNEKGKKMRLIMQSKPIAFTSENKLKVTLNNLRDVRYLLDEEGIWLRISSDDNVFHWSRDKESFCKGDILSVREKEVLREWMLGKNILEITNSLFISSNTVKNHLKSMRKKLLARDNTALVELALLSGIIKPTYLF